MKNKNFKLNNEDRIYGREYFEKYDFIQFPTLLLHEKKYQNLSASAKLAYMVLQNSLNYSVKKNCFNENGDIYFLFSNKELQALFNCSTDQVIQIIKELEQFELLKQEQRENGQPPRLYLMQLEITDNNKEK